MSNLAVQQFPIAEIFTSPQGEGFWAGTRMTFIRFAGCNVGKPYTAAAREALGLQVYQERCTAWNGESFACDTNYRVKQRLTVREILALPEIESAERVLLTGGEPLVHDLVPLLQALREDKAIHVETSGTLDFDFEYYDSEVWVCVSPKQGVLGRMLARADEIKLLIDAKTFNEEAFKPYTCLEQYAAGRVFISAVNEEHTLNEDNNRFCLQLQEKYPRLRLTLQAHKIWGCR